MAKLSYKMSYYALYVCFALILVVLGMFYFVGYNNPVGEYNEPAHTETLIYLMYGMFGVCVAVTLVGAIAQFGAALRDNPMSAVKSLLGIVLLVVVLVFTHFLSSAGSSRKHRRMYCHRLDMLRPVLMNRQAFCL